MRWTGTIAQEGEMTGDGRIIEPNALVWEDLPIPLRWVPELEHSDPTASVQCGWIETLARQGDGSIFGTGTIFEPAAEAYVLAAGQSGVSIDPDQVEFSLILADAVMEADVVPGVPVAIGEDVMQWQHARIRAATLCDIPAFINAIIKPDPEFSVPPTAGPAIIAATDVPASPVPPESDGGSAPTHAGLAVHAQDTGRVLMLQRALDPTDPASGTWEFPGGSIDPGDSTPYDGACREFCEETGLPVPDGQQSTDWTSDDGVYQCFVLSVPVEAGAFDSLNPDVAATQHINPDDPQREEPEVTAWFDPMDLATMPSPPLRQEVADGTDWSIFDPEASDMPRPSSKMATPPPTPPPVPAPEDQGPHIGDEVVGTVTAVNPDGSVVVEPTTPVGGGNDDAPPAGLAAVPPPVPPKVGDHVDVAGAPHEITEVDDQGGIKTKPKKPETPALVASAGGTTLPPSSWFSGKLSGPTPLTVTAEGRVFGHLALNDTCHADFGNQCITPPAEDTFDFFHLGAVTTADGDELPVGRLTVGGGHADRSMGLRAAIQHYDDATTTAAVVRAERDKFGIALFGSLVAGVTDEQIQLLKACPPSGDWRKVNGNYRLTTAHAVNVPGYPVMRTGLVAASGGDNSMILTWNIAPNDGVVNLESVRNRLAKSVGLDTETRRQALAARVTGKG